MKKITAILSCFALGLVITVKAQTQGVDQRRANQRERIHQGVLSGELTRRETANAAHHQGHIRRAERRSKADGIVTRRERAHLHHMQNRASRDLRRNKHDAQARRNAH
ncbi:MAG: hypothetical protein OEV74_19290 [Cyclobacteriaceae bacterium]|nr:hypothetical protein [Cyclobacteriaceae bacterium]MDH4298429.1 hypothetical protein [Cyclobacteriaceae bacterium]